MAPDLVSQPEVVCVGGVEMPVAQAQAAYREGVERLAGLVRRGAYCAGELGPLQRYFQRRLERRFDATLAEVNAYEAALFGAASRQHGLIPAEDAEDEAGYRCVVHDCDVQECDCAWANGEFDIPDELLGPNAYSQGL